jgi:hypothetical protein
MFDTLIREMGLEPDGELNPNRKPAGLAVTGPREGGPMRLEFRGVFIDADGAVLAGGHYTVQWYWIAYPDAEVETARRRGPFAYRAQSGVATGTLDVEQELPAADDFAPGVSIVLTTPAWPWPQVTAFDPPDAVAQQVLVTVGSSADGTWSIQVDEDEPLEFEASGDTAEDIRDGLLALFAAHPTLTASAGAEVDELLLEAQVAGVPFTLTLDAPGDALTQETTEANVNAPAGFQLHGIIAAGAPHDQASSTALTETVLELTEDVADLQATAALGLEFPVVLVFAASATDGEANFTAPVNLTIKRVSLELVPTTSGGAPSATVEIAGTPVTMPALAVPDETAGGTSSSVAPTAANTATQGQSIKVLYAANSNVASEGATVTLWCEPTGN